MYYPSGAKYSGGWKDGKRHAKGDMLYANGDVYKGNWSDNLPNGQGQFTGINGSHYAGGWQDGKVRIGALFFLSRRSDNLIGHNEPVPWERSSHSACRQELFR